MTNRKSTTAANSRKARKAAPKAKAAKPINHLQGSLAGYRGHRPGSNKESIHKLFDSCKDRAKIIAACEKADLSPATAATWIATWGGMKAAGLGLAKANKAPKASEAKAA